MPWTILVQGPPFITAVVVFLRTTYSFSAIPETQTTQGSPPRMASSNSQGKKPAVFTLAKWAQRQACA